MSFNVQDIFKRNTPLVMGILNLTPDSFYDGGRYDVLQEALKKTGEMLDDGAAIIDVGAYSSRPNARHITQEEEEARLFPVLEQLLHDYPKALFSIDTFRSEIAVKSIAMGAHLINDISGGNMDKAMFNRIAELQVPYILMHMQGTPQNMQNNPTYGDVVQDVYKSFEKKVEKLEQLGVKDVILDVGFGFGKTLEQNYQLLQNLSQFKKLEKPLLVGMSRKSMLYKLLDKTPETSLHATGVVHTVALMHGADILRVHDVKEAMETVKIYAMLKKASL